MGDLFDFTLRLQQKYTNSTSAEYRREKGQVFTPPEIARFMAALFSEFPREFRLLDAGAGLGSLTVAVCERYLRLRSPRRLEVHAFENDPKIATLLADNLRQCKRTLRRAGHSFQYFVCVDDFVAAASPHLNGYGLFGEPAVGDDFEGVIMNPPYFKLRKDSKHAKLLAKIVHGQPNVYAFFLTLAARLLREQGELITITPRSFCNGLYFRGFRHWFFDHMSLDHIHLFESRTETFRDAGILQESVITKSHRFGKPSETTTISSSFGREIDPKGQVVSVPIDQVIDRSSGDDVVRIPTTAQDCRVMELVESFPTTFSQTGLRISTGPVVMFRATEFLLHEENSSPSVPLLLPENVKPFSIVWPIRNKKKPVAFRDCRESLSLLLPTSNYVLLKRFSAKEEKRRLTAGCFLREEQRSARIAMENHLNYIYHGNRGLTVDETYGLAALFNSSLFDRYFRIISGNTQVNATEIRTLRFPDLSTVAKIGKRVSRLKRVETGETEQIVLEELRTGKHLREGSCSSCRDPVN